MNTENAIEVKNLSKKYDGFLLDNISFQIPYGSITGFVGENGAGKSTTIKSILGLLKRDSGEIKVLNHTPDESNDSWKEEIGVVFDECNYPGDLKIPDIHHMLRLIYQTWDAHKFMEYMQRFELPTNKKVKEFSKGMKMKLSIAVALSHNSRVLILDEATSGLDPVIRSEILDIFREFIVDESHAVFMSSHITSDIEKISDYIMLIHKGRLLFTENKDELIYNYGLVKCSQEQMKSIPGEMIVGMERGSFENCVLVKNRKALEGKGLIIDRANIEDILVYIVKGSSGLR